MHNFDNLDCLNTALNTGAFLCSKDNVMVISWGMVGVMWHKRVFAVPVRESRFTKQFIDETGVFTVCIPNQDEMKDAIKFCGTKSGRDYDKWQECNLQKLPAKSIDCSVVGGCKKVFECRVIGQFEMKDMDLSFVKNCYMSDDRHTLYIGEIVEEY